MPNSNTIHTTAHTDTIVSHRYQRRVVFILVFILRCAFIRWIAFGIHIHESTIVGKNSFEACFKPSTSTVAASGQLRRRAVSERYEYLSIYLHPPSFRCLCVFVFVHYESVNVNKLAQLNQVRDGILTERYTQKIQLKDIT